MYLSSLPEGNDDNRGEQGLMDRRLTSPKVFCIGLPKTGNVSLSHALTLLGYSMKCGWTFKSKPKHMMAVSFYDAASELCGIVDFEEMKEWHPTARLIWTQRQLEPWLVSAEARMGQHRPVRSKMQRHRIKRFGAPYFSKGLWTEFYHALHEKIETYKAANPEENILHMNITEGDGWETLCPFLGVEQPGCALPHYHMGVDNGPAAVPFPHRNSSRPKATRT